MTKADIEARVQLLEARVETLSRRLTQVIGENPENLSEHDAAILDALKEWRQQRARQEGVPVYVVFPDKALTAIASSHPADKFEMSQIKGIADKRIADYGDDVLAILEQHKPGPDGEPW